MTISVISGKVSASQATRLTVIDPKRCSLAGGVRQGHSGGSARPTDRPGPPAALAARDASIPAEVDADTVERRPGKKVARRLRGRRQGPGGIYLSTPGPFRAPCPTDRTIMQKVRVTVIDDYG